MRTKQFIVSIVVFCSIFICAAMSVFKFEAPNNFPKPFYDFDKNPLSVEKIKLGKMLFYDPILSSDSTISCSSCHSPFNSFAHTDHDLSHGIHDSIGTRNAPALMNLAWQTLFMWDGAINHLDMQALAPISHAAEMNESIKNVVEKLSRQKTYKEEFAKIYVDKNITGERVLKCLSQFQLTLVSANAKYDKVKRQEDTFTKKEQKGYTLYQKKCSNCHAEPLFSTYEFANNGLEIDTTLNDYGRWMVTKNSADSLKFKIPTLRNLSFTYPYMHDGRFAKLRDVLNHYTDEIIQSPTLAPQLQNKLSLTSNEKTELIAFLLTLNDKEFVFNENFRFSIKNISTPEGN